MEKICSKCKKSKELSQFSKDKKGRLGVCVWCKVCASDYKKTIQKKAWEKERFKLHTDKTYHDYIRGRDRAWRRDNPKLHLFRSAKTRAKRKGIEFTITHEDVVIPEYCPILGCSFIAGTKGDYKYSYSLDRVENSKGYVKGNVRVISALANHMKNQASAEELKAFAKNILAYIE